MPFMKSQVSTHTMLTRAARCLWSTLHTHYTNQAWKWFLHSWSQRRVTTIPSIPTHTTSKAVAESRIVNQSQSGSVRHRVLEIHWSVLIQMSKQMACIGPAAITAVEIPSTERAMPVQNPAAVSGAETSDRDVSSENLCIESWASFRSWKRIQPWFLRC